MIEQGGSVTEAIYGAGFGSSAGFYAGAGTALGMTPSQRRAGGRGMTIRAAFGQSSLGQVLVAATERGVCAILIGDDPNHLTADLDRRFPNAARIPADPDFAATVALVVAFVETPSGAAAFPLDIIGTAFQERVWAALRCIPAGTTASYAEIARAIGKPSAVRAVAHACAANPIAFAVPCHRVIHGDGTMSGYRWGVERKRELLRREGSWRRG
jgi:AraC family transcriptional regulator of adaptative response/methylated-DNA-[protein]-cysteine methyltransferase